MRMTIIGSGYVGLVSGACFSEFGFEVTCVDQDQQKIENLNNGIIPIYEPGLDSLVNNGKKSGRLSFTTDLKTAMKDSHVIMIAVGTPARRGDGYADLKYVYQAAKEVAQNLNGYAVIVTKSTVPVGTSRQVENIIKEIRPELQKGTDFDVASNPEFLREGSAIDDFMRPDRVVIGVENDHAKETMRKLYRPLYLVETPIIFTSLETSELIKYAANGFLSMKIAFINQIADLCEKANADVQDVAKAIGLDGRIGRKFLNVGPGYGGSCFPKDTLALSRTAHDLNSPLTLIDAVIEANDKRKLDMADKIISALKEKTGSVKGKTLSILGITFKPNTDDLRDAPSLTIIPKLLEAGIKVKVYDPLYYKGAERLNNFNEFLGVEWSKNSYETMENSDGIIILTEWNEFRALDMEQVKSILHPAQNGKPLLIDMRNIYKLHEMSDINYISLGRPSPSVETA